MPGLEEANAELDRLIAADAKGTTGAQVAEGNQAGADEAQRAAQQAADEAQSDEAKAEGERLKAEAETKSKEDAEAKAKADEAAKLKAETEAKGKTGEKSRYAKAQERLGKTWEEVNAAKAALKAEQDALKTEREKIEADRREFDGRREQAEKEFTPDQYDAAARKFENEGKFDLAELAREKASALRKNPPQPRAAADEAQRKEWAMKAGTDFPELTKDRSPLQVRVAQLFQEEPDLKVHPKGIYVAARIADLEAQSAKGKAAEQTVATRDKELADARSKIKELEALTAPGGGNGTTRLPAAKSFEQMTPDEQYSQLQRECAEVGSIR